MKPLDDRVLQKRVLLEPGLPPLVQESGLREGWDTALPLPSLYALTRGVPDRPPMDHVMAGLREAGEVFVHIATNGQWPSGMQFLNFSWLAAEDEALAAALMDGIWRHYPEVERAYDFIDDEGRPALLPRISRPDELLPFIRLDVITIHPVPHASTPYLGFDFACTWDDEHGLGVLTWGTEILDIGIGEVSGYYETAEAHRERLLARLREEPPSA